MNIELEILAERFSERVAIMLIDGEASENEVQKIFNAAARWCKERQLPLPQSIRDEYRRVLTGRHR